MKSCPPARRLPLLTSLLLLLCFWAGEVHAKPFVHQLFTSNMVLQRDPTNTDPVWGWVPAGTTVTVVVKDQTGATFQTKTATPDANGRWQVNVGPFSAVPGNAAYSMVISAPGQTTQTLTNVMIGDVWLCMGQSNMAYTLSTLPVSLINRDAEIADSINYPNVRVVTTNSTLSLAPLDNVANSTWKIANPSNTGNFSATAYFTCREIFKQQNVPIGAVVSAWSGTEIKAWTDPTFAATQADFKQQIYDSTGVGYVPVSTTVSAIYNGMVSSLAPFRFKGVVWYQGESNTYGSATPSGGEQYSRLLPAFRSNLRTIFGNPGLPFIVIQLAPTNAPNANVVDNDNAGYPALREAQLKTVTGDANSRIVTTTDLGDADGDIHPDNKQDVGHRAALAAANVAYGQSVVNQGPILTSAVVSGSTIVCTFSNTGAGLMVGTKPVHSLTPVSQVVGGTLTGFAISATKGGPFVAATATISSPTTVTVSAAGISAPVAVRYGWKNYPVCNLYNKIVDGGGNVVDGMPASPFRNDPTYRLTANAGTITPGDASFPFTSLSYVLNSTAAVTASTFPGLTFTNWSGDTSFLASSLASSTTGTFGQTFASFLANYDVTAAPANFVATPLNGQVRLTWSPINGAHYNLLRAITSGGPYTPIAAATNLYNTLSYVDGSLTNGSTYYYKIFATNLTSTGPESVETSAKPLATIAPLQLPGSEISLQQPPSTNVTAFLPTVDYNVTEADVTASGRQLPIYTPFDSSTDRWWDNLVGELLQARMPYALLPTQGYSSATVGNNNDPRQLDKLTAALSRAGASGGLIRFGCLLDFASGQDIYNTLHSVAAGTPMNLATTTTTDWDDVFWTRMVKPWFDRIGSTLWYIPGSGRPLIHVSALSAADFSNAAGHAYQVLNEIDAQMFAAYGVHPWFILDSTWQAVDPTAVSLSSVWLCTPGTFTPNSASNYMTAKGNVGGTIMPGYVDPTNSANFIARSVNTTGGAGALGDTLKNALAAGITANAKVAVIEAWNDAVDSAGLYRSTDANWATANQYLDLVRATADLRTATLRLEAEAFDEPHSGTATAGVYRREGNLHIRALSPGGWAVTATTANQAVQFKNIQFSPGNYRFSIRYSSTAPHKVRLQFDSGYLPDVALPSTGGMDTWSTINIGLATNVTQAMHSLTLYFVDGGVDLDWIFVHKADPLVSFQSSSNSMFVCAEAAGNSVLNVNRTAAGSYEHFSVNSTTGTVNSGDTVSLQTSNGYYWSASGSTLLPNKRAAGTNEKFVITKVSGSGPLVNGDAVTIKTWQNRYATTTSGNALDASGTTIGPAQTFIVNLSAQ